MKTLIEYFETLERRISFLETQLKNLATLATPAPLTAPEVLDTDALVSYLGNVSKGTIYRWIHVDYIPNFKIGRRVYFRRNEIDSWMQSKRRFTKSETIHKNKNIKTKTK